MSSLVKNSLVLANDDHPLHLWSVQPTSPPHRAVLFLHGSTLPGLVFDIPVQGASWQERLAADGFATYALDLRGFGQSHKPAGDAAHPVARAADACQDALRAVQALRQAGITDITLVGSSWGTIVAGMLLTQHPDAAERLVQYAPIYGEPNPAWLTRLLDPDDTTQIAPMYRVPYRQTTAAALTARWDSDMPIADKSDWRDETVLQTLFDRTISAGKSAFGTPNGPFHDLAETFSGRLPYDANRLSQPLYIVRPDADSTSQHGDAQRLYERAGSKQKRYDILPNGSHFMFLENGAPRLFAAVRDFLA